MFFSPEITSEMFNIKAIIFCIGLEFKKNKKEKMKRESYSIHAFLVYMAKCNWQK